MINKSDPHYLAAIRFREYCEKMLAGYPDADHLKLGKEVIQKWLELLDRDNVTKQDADELKNIFVSQELGTAWHEIKEWFQDWYNRLL